MSKVDFLYLSEQEMIKAGVLDSKGCVDTIEEVFRLLSRGDYIMGGPKENSHGVMMWFPEEKRFNMPLAGPDRRFMAMIAYLGGKFNICGEKWYGSNVENPRLRKLPRSILMVMLNDPETSAPLALMSANLISAMRTGAVPGVAARHLAKSDASTAGIVGAGVISKATLLAINAGRPNIRTAWVYDIVEEKSRNFVKEMAEHDIKVNVAASLEECVRNSDVIAVATAGKNIVRIEENWLKEGVLLETSGALNVPDSFCLNNKIVVDNWKMHQEWREEGLASAGGLDAMTWAPTQQVIKLQVAGKIDENKDIANLGDVIEDKVPGRENDKEKIFFLAGGMPVHDIAWGKMVYNTAKEKNLGVNLNLWEEPHWF
ncbi:tyramine oxidase subunit B [Cloacibacillus evryensis]|uniref:tyramine oxidase subunit B n=1 Tax=Cloacibacillus evryensis TaxID=508460 RepID=UPI00241BF6E6|nr:tyramine oxidase subunit B [Cloacibacillus evryensis]